MSIASMPVFGVPTQKSGYSQCKWRKSFVDSLRSEELWFGHDWKEFVWYSRKGRQPPARYDEFWKPSGAELIKGHLYKNSSRIITNIEQADVQTALAESNVRTIRNQSFKSTQWCLLGIDVMIRFGAEIRGKIHVDITPPLQLQIPMENTTA